MRIKSWINLGEGVFACDYEWWRLDQVYDVKWAWVGATSTVVLSQIVFGDSRSLWKVHNYQYQFPQTKPSNHKRPESTSACTTQKAVNRCSRVSRTTIGLDDYQKLARESRLYIKIFSSSVGQSAASFWSSSDPKYGRHQQCMNLKSASIAGMYFM